MNGEKQILIDKFFQMIRRLNGTAVDLLEVKRFFTLATETKQYTHPTVEFMTVLRAYRPLLFHEFKALLVPNSSMCLLANTSFDLGQAIINLGMTTEEQLQRAVKGSSLQ